MPTLQKSDLQYEYSWTALEPDDPKVTGKPDSTLLNRNEGYEILAFLNKHFEDKLVALSAETLIQKKLPSDIRSHTNVLEWLKTKLETLS